MKPKSVVWRVIEKIVFIRKDKTLNYIYFYKQGSTTGTKRLTIKLILMQNTLQIFWSYSFLNSVTGGQS